MFFRLDKHGLCQDCAFERQQSEEKQKALRQAKLDRLNQLSNYLHRIKADAEKTERLEDVAALIEEMFPIYSEVVLLIQTLNEADNGCRQLPPGDVFELLAKAYEEEGRFQEAYILRQKIACLGIPISQESESCGDRMDDWRAREEERQKWLTARLEAQDRQLDLLKDADALYKIDHDLASYIAFWEDVMANGGLLFHSSYWEFRLPDLYIKAKRYDDALKALNQINQPYEEKKFEYIIKIYIRQERYEEALVLLERTNCMWYEKKAKYIAEINKRKEKQSK